MSDPMTEWLLAMLQKNQAGDLAPNVQGPGNSPQLAATLQAGLGGQPTDASSAFGKLTDNINAGTPGAPPDPNAPSGAEAMNVLADHKYPPQPIPASRTDALVDNTPLGGGKAQANPFQFGTHQDVIGQSPDLVGTPLPAKGKKDLSALLPLLKVALGGGHDKSYPASGGVGHATGAGAINPSIPVLATLPLPGVNLRDRLAKSVRP